MLSSNNFADFDAKISERHMEQQLREMLGERLTCESICHYPEVVGFVSLLRFLRISNHDLNVAYASFVSYLEMRIK
jgi:hypothetical protein